MAWATESGQKGFLEPRHPGRSSLGEVHRRLQPIVTELLLLSIGFSSVDQGTRISIFPPVNLETVDKLADPVSMHSEHAL